MKAMVQDVYGSADVLELKEIDKPQIGEREVLVRVQAAGVDRGVWHLMTGRPYALRLGFGVRRPRMRVRGGDVAGIVEAVGSAVTRFTVGDAVMGTSSGSFAEYARAREDQLVLKPALLTFEQAAAIPTSASTALQALRDQGHVTSGQRVLIIGASGGVGTFAVQIAKALGAEVTGVASTAKVDLVRSLGADHVIDYSRDDFADGSMHYDVVLDIGGHRSLSHLRRTLTKKGTLVIVGGEDGGQWVGATVGRDLRALALSPFVSQTLRMFFAKVTAPDLEALNEFIEAGKITPTIDRTYALGEAAEAIRCLEAGRVRGKLVISVG